VLGELAAGTAATSPVNGMTHHGLDPGLPEQWIRSGNGVIGFGARSGRTRRRWRVEGERHGNWSRSFAGR